MKLTNISSVPSGVLINLFTIKIKAENASNGQTRPATIRLPMRQATM